MNTIVTIKIWLLEWLMIYVSVLVLMITFATVTLGVPLPAMALRRYALTVLMDATHALVRRIYSRLVKVQKEKRNVEPNQLVMQSFNFM